MPATTVAPHHAKQDKGPKRGLGRILAKVDPRKALDLRDRTQIADVLHANDRRRTLAALADEIAIEQDRLEQRARYCQAKAIRLKIGSNGRQKMLAEAASCVAASQLLSKTVKGEADKIHPDAGHRSDHVNRALRLARQVQAA
jgi:hypothetical protein